MGTKSLHSPNKPLQHSRATLNFPPVKLAKFETVINIHVNEQGFMMLLLTASSQGAFNESQ